MNRIMILGLVILLVGGVMPVSAATERMQRPHAPDQPPRVDERPSAVPGIGNLKHPTLASALVAVSRQAHEAGDGSALTQARTAGLDVEQDRVRVTIVTKESSTGHAEALVRQVGGTVEWTSSRAVQALVPPTGLETLAADPSVHAVRSAERPHPTAIIGEQVNASGANVWQAAGAAGSGVKIAVIDGGFQGFEARQASGDLPPSLYTRSYCSAAFPNNAGGNHGTAVAEIVYDVAPGARLFLYCAETLSEMRAALTDIIAQGVHIVVHARVIFYTSRGDGTLPPGAPQTLPEALVTDAHNHGILWVNSAGNNAEHHWSGTYSDPENDDFHNFQGTDVGNTLTIPTNGTVTITLKWDDWPGSDQDYDLVLARSSDSATMATSENPQVGSGQPVEALSFTNAGPTQNFFIAIYRYNATETPRFDLAVVGGSSPLEYRVAASSIDDFSSSPRSMAAGSACWQTNQVDTFSARGPTIDGRVKPDIAGHASTSTATFGPSSSCATGFVGTSVSAPHIGGAAALVKDANPTFSKAQIQAFLEARALDVGQGGKDNTAGAGIVALGALPLPGVACSPRPNVTIQNAVQAGALVSTVGVTGAGNRLLRLAFGNGPRTPVNALLSFADGTTNLAGTPTYYTPFGSTQATFTSKRSAAGPVTVPLLVHDRCGTWPTFVGAGTGVPGL